MQMNLVDLGTGRDPNYRYVLVYIDIFTCHVWLPALPH